MFIQKFIKHNANTKKVQKNKPTLNKSKISKHIIK